jgi:apolipoprotein N-acyltransferase
MALWKRLLLAALSGGSIALVFLDFSFYPLGWVAFTPLLLALADIRTTREALWVGAAAGLATNVPAFHWLTYTIDVFGGFPYPAALFFYACLSCYSACQFVLFALGVRCTGLGPLGLAAPVLWVSLEFIYPNLFPWRMGHTQFHVPVLIQVGDLTGPMGLSFVLVWFSSGVVLTLRRPRRWVPLGAATVAAAVVIAYGTLRMPVVKRAIEAARRVNVGLVQGNVSIVEKGTAASFEINLEKYRRLTMPLQSKADLLIWPETVFESWVHVKAGELPDAHSPFPGLTRYLVFGGLAFSDAGPERYEKFNSAFLLAPDGSILGRYDKQILMPFGEYLPGAALVPALAAFSPNTGDFTAGERIVTLDVPGLVRLAPLICYEDVPASIARAMTRAGAEAIVTLFNDAWFGHSAAPYQHEALALWRAVENRRYFLRVGNAGVTGAIDPLGRVLGRLGLFTAECLQVEVRPLRLLTFYTQYGDVFAWTIVLISGGFLFQAWRVCRS